MLKFLASLVFLISRPVSAASGDHVQDPNSCALRLVHTAANDNEIKILRFPSQPARVRMESNRSAEVMLITGANETIRVDFAHPTALTLKDWARAVELASALPAYQERIQLYRAAMWRVIHTQDDLSSRSMLLYILVQGASRLYAFEPQESRSILEMISKFVIMDKLNPDLGRRMKPLMRLSLLSSIVAGLHDEGLPILGDQYQLLLQEWGEAQHGLTAEARG